MKPHLPLVLLSALIFSHSPALAITPSDTAINLSTGNVSLEGGTQTGEIKGTGDLTIASGAVTINHSSGSNSYSGTTTIDAGATLSIKNWTGASATEYKQLGTSTLLLSGTLDINTGDKNPANRLLTNDITLSHGARINTDDHGITFGGNLTLENGTATMHMNWGNEWVFSGNITGAGTFNFTGGNNETQLFVLQGASNTFSGTYQLNKDKSGLILEHTNAAKGAHVVLNNADAYLVLKNIDATIGGLTGNGIVRNGVLTRGNTGSFTAGTVSKTLTVNQTNEEEDIFTGKIENNVNLTKAGVGTLTLTNLAGYTGNLGVQGGTLSLKLATDSIYDLAKVTGTGGTLHLESGTFSIGGTAIGTVSLGGATLTANGATLLIDILGTESDTISFTGALTGTLNIDFNIAGASMGQAFTIMTTDSAANAAASLSALKGESQFYKGGFINNGANIQFELTGYADDLLQWNGGTSGNWSNGSTSWLANGAAASFDSSKSVLFGEQAETNSATITLDAGGITTKGVMIESNNTHYTLTGGALTTEVFVKNGDSNATLDLVYNISKLQINGGSLELKQASANTLTILGAGTLKVNWGANDISNVLLSGHEGALILAKGGIRTNLLDLASESSISMAGGKLYLTDTGNINIALTDLSVSGTDSKIIRDSAGNITWNTALTGDGKLTLDLDGTLNLGSASNFSAFDGTLAVNGNINIQGSQTISFKPGAGLILGEGKTLNMDWNSKVEGSGILTLSKNTVVKMGNGALTASQIVLAAAGGNVTFSGFTWGDSNLNGKITGTANQLIFDHNDYGNNLNHSNWAGSDYIGTTIFKATSKQGGNHNYKVAADSTGAITPWGVAGNLVQIGSLEMVQSIYIKFSELNANGSVSIGNKIELITGSAAGNNSTLEFTSGSYDLTDTVTIKNGVNGANKAIIKSSGANITLSGGLSGAGPLDIDMATGKTLLLSGTSDYTGTLSVVTGILSLGTDFATGSIQVNANGILTASGDRSISNLTLNGGDINLAGDNNLSIKSLVDNSETKGIIKVADTSSVTFTNDLSDLSVGNKITGTGSVKIAAGADKTVSLTGTNDYSGKTQITSGTAKAGNASSFGTSEISVSGGKLDANNQKLTNKINIASGTISNLGAQGERAGITITATADSTIAIDNSFVSVANMNTAANQKITLGNGSDMLVTGNSTFVVSSENISTSFAEKGACLFSVSSDSALVINGTLTLDFTADAFNAYTQAGATLSINLFDLLTGGTLDLDALTKIVFKNQGDTNVWLTLDKDAQSDLFKNLATTGYVDLSFTGVPPIGPIIPGGAIPEPSSTGLALLGAAGLLLRRRRRQAV